MLSLARRRLNVLWAMLRDGTTYTVRLPLWQPDGQAVSGPSTNLFCIVQQEGLDEGPHRYASGSAAGEGRNCLRLRPDGQDVGVGCPGAMPVAGLLIHGRRP